jgi:hypothetical protein
MATVQSERPTLAGQRPTDAPADRNRTPPIAWWGAIGAVFLAFAAYLIIHWLASGEAHRVSSGPTHLPTWMKICLGCQQWGLFAGMCALVYFKVIRPRMQTGRVPLDGLMVISFALLWWSDPFYNYFQVGFNYNAWFVNLGSWVGGAPGWMSPNASRTPQPLFWLPGVYTCWFYGMVLFVNVLMRRLYVWRPRLSMPATWTITFVPTLILGSILESLMMRMGSHTYGGSIRWLTISPGKYYEFPIYQGITGAILFTTWGAMRFYRDDQGYSFAERGIQKLKVGKRATGWLRFFAVSGAITTIFFLGYHLPNALFAAEGGAWPHSVLQRSYFTDDLCGPRTTVACPGPNTPIALTDSARIGPNGKLIIPSGVTLPKLVSQAGTR